MTLRVGALLAITGLTLALLFGSMFVVVGGLLIVCGGIVLAIGMEPLLAEEERAEDLPPESVRAEHGDVAA
jgi:hypothetical protein